MTKAAIIVTAASLIGLGACTVNTSPPVAVAPAPTPAVTVINPPPPAVTTTPGSVLVPGRY